MNDRFCKAKEGQWQVWKTVKADTSHLLEIFPEEVWIQILDKIVDPETMLQLTEAALFWRKLLHPRRTEYLFPQVLGILDAQKLLSEGIFRYRFVCKSWKISVDRLLENVYDCDRPQFQKHQYHPCLFNIPYATHFDVYEPRNLNLVNAERKNAIGQSVEYCQKNLLLYSPSKIFPNRHLRVSEYNPNWPRSGPFREECFYENKVIVTYFLKTVGHHFWIADLYLSEWEDVESLYDATCEQVALLPNLKSLTINYTLSRNRLSPVLSRSFPTLSNLQMLQLCGGLDPFPKCARDRILQANPHIKVLYMDGVNCASLAFPAFTSLHTLSVDLGNATEDFHLPPLKGLKSLRLRFRSCLGVENSLKWSTIFRQLEQYKLTLEKLCLCLPCGDENGMVQDFPSALTEYHYEEGGQLTIKPLDLPNVKTLQLSLCENNSLDFLSGLHSLEFLSLYLLYHDFPPPILHFELSCNVETVRVGLEEPTNSLLNGDHSFPDFYRTSNIWQLIPSVKKIEVASPTTRTKIYMR